MFKDITLGQYFPNNSFVHRLDPRIKLISVFMYMVFLFMIEGLIGYIAATIFVVGVALVSELKLSYLYRGIKPLRWIILITFIINVIFTPGNVLYSIGSIEITQEGLILASKLAGRLALLVMGTSLLTLTTSPLELTDGLEGVLAPLNVVKFPVHEIAMMMTIALRFIPTLIDETDRIMKAQMARGADFESGNVLKRARNMVPLLVPLILSAISRADELSIAMEARCYRGSEGRSKLNPLKLRAIDIITLIGLAVFFFLVVYLDKI